MIKIYPIIEVLSTKQKQEIRVELQKKDKERLVRLFNFLVKRKPTQEVSKKKLFKLVFESDFPTNGDMLLRNEIRLLSNWIKEHLRFQLLEKRAQKNPLEGVDLLLKQYLEKKKFSLFEKEWRKYMLKCQSQRDYNTMAELYNIYTTYLEEKKEVKMWVYKKIDELSNLQIDYHTAAFKEQIRHTEIRKTKANKFIQAFQPTHQMPSLLSKVELTAREEEEIVKYHYLRAKSYLESGQEKIDTLKELEAYYYRIVKFRPAFYGDISLIYGSIGLEYFLQGDYLAAYDAYVKTLSYLEKLKQPFNPNLYYNYVSILFKLDRYEELIEAILNHQEDIQESERLKYRYEYMLVMSYLFTDDVNKAFQLVHQDINKRPESEYYNFRYVYAICFYLMNDIDSFEREIINIKQKIDYQPPIERDFIHLYELFHTFIKWQFYATEKQEKEKLYNRIQERLEIASEDVRLFKDMLLSKWLIREIDAINQT